MEIINTKGLPLVVIDDFYSEEELDLIWQELNFIVKPKNLKTPEENGSAKDESGNLLKDFKGINLDEVFPNRIVSNILTVNRKTFKQELRDELVNNNVFFRYLDISNQDSTKICVYRDGESYKTHRDSGIITCVSMFCREPKPFTGGDLIVEDVKVEYRNNRFVMFPGILMHEVTPVNIPNNNLENARYTMLQFMGVKLYE